MEVKWTWLLWIALAVGILTAIALFLPIQSHAQVPSITLDWTATGDDGNVGTAASQEIRWSASRPDTTGMATWLAAGGAIGSMPSALRTWWNGATRVTGMPAPRVAGTAETFDVTGPFTTGQTYYFILQVCDETPNCVGSNLASKFLPDITPPSRILDLRVR